MRILGGFHIWRPQKNSDLLTPSPPFTVTNQLNLFLLSPLWGPPSPAHYGRHIWKPPWQKGGLEFGCAGVHATQPEPVLLNDETVLSLKLKTRLCELSPADSGRQDAKSHSLVLNSYLKTVWLRNPYIEKSLTIHTFGNMTDTPFSCSKKDV